MKCWPAPFFSHEIHFLRTTDSTNIDARNVVSINWNRSNKKDLAEIPDNVKRGLEIIPVTIVDDVLKHALTKPLVPIEWDEEAEIAKVAAKKAGTGDLDGVVTH